MTSVGYDQLPIATHSTSLSQLVRTHLNLLNIQLRSPILSLAITRAASAIKNPNVIVALVKQQPDVFFLEFADVFSNLQKKKRGEGVQHTYTPVS